MKRVLPSLRRHIEFSTATSAPSRCKLVTMQVPAEKMAPLLTPPLLKLSGIFRKHGYELRIAGGAVRDLLSGGVPHDLDLATTATPTQMKSMFAEETAAVRASDPLSPEHGGFRLFNNNGERHGTVSLRVDDQVNFEVTTLRTDVVTDGRRAEVKFVNDWKLDAERRDLTVNALFLGLDGQVYDYCGGCEDVRLKKVRFNGDPAVRITEDYLRILRYFRFYGRLAHDPDSHDITLLDTIQELAHGLARISGERLWMELRQILSGRHCCHLVPRMCECGIGVYLGLPDRPNLDRFRETCRYCDALKQSEGNGSEQPHLMVLLAALLDSRDQMLALHARLKLSALERDMALFIIENRPPPDSACSDEERLLEYRKLLVSSRFTARHGNLYVVNLMYSHGCDAALIQQLRHWTVPPCPLAGADLKQAGIPEGRALGRVMTELRQLWADSAFQMSREQLLEQVPRFYQPRSPNRKRKMSPAS